MSPFVAEPDDDEPVVVELPVWRLAPQPVVAAELELAAFAAYAIELWRDDE